MGRAEDIAAVRHFIRKCGWKIRIVDMVKEWGASEVWTNGGTERGVKTVYLSRRLRGLKKFYVLLHEAGHVLSYEAELSDAEFSGLRSEGNKVMRSDRRSAAHRNNERQAYLLGTALASKLRIRLDQKKWRDFDWEAHGCLR